MSVWRVIARLAAVAAIFLIATIAMPSAGLAHAGHAGAHAVGHGGVHEAAMGEPAGEAAVAPRNDRTSGDGRHGSCAAPCCNAACSTACTNPALSNAAVAPSPDTVLVGHLGAPHESLPTDPPERRLPKPPRI